MKPGHGLSMYYRAVNILDLWFEEVYEFCRECKLRKQSEVTIGRLKFCMNFQLFDGTALFICFRLLWGKMATSWVHFFVGDNPSH